MNNRWSVYLIRCNDNSLYTGISNNVTKRFETHQNGNGNTTKYTRCRRPLQLVFQVFIGSKSQASKMECKIKKLTKDKKEQLISGNIKIKDLDLK
jgi:putative endonuclease